MNIKSGTSDFHSQKLYVSAFQSALCLATWGCDQHSLARKWFLVHKSSLTVEIDLLTTLKLFIALHDGSLCILLMIV